MLMPLETGPVERNGVRPVHHIAGFIFHTDVAAVVERVVPGSMNGLIQVFRAFKMIPIGRGADLSVLDRVGHFRLPQLTCR